MEWPHSRRGIRRSIDIAVLVCNLPQRGNNFCRVPEIPFDETVDLLVGAGMYRFRRVPYPNVRELIYV